MKYIYALIDPLSNEICYVGQTSMNINRRLYGHISILRGNTHKVNWIKKLKRLGHKPIMKVIQSFESISDKDLSGAEIYWIKYFRNIGCKLTNSTDGGEGTRGTKLSEETIRKMSLSHIGNKSTLGYKHTDDAKFKMSQAHVGYKHTDQAKFKMSQAQIGRLYKEVSIETKKKISKSLIGNKRSLGRIPWNKGLKLKDIRDGE